MYYFNNKFPKIANRWRLYDFGRLKLRDLAKLRFLNWLW